MSVQTQTLAEFLQARVIDDLAALETARRMGVPSLGMGSRVMSGIGNHPTVTEARIDAECQAKMRILGSFHGAASALAAQADPIKRMVSEAMLMAHEDAVKAAAFVYADHPDYRVEWRP